MWSMTVLRKSSMSIRRDFDVDIDVKSSFNREKIGTRAMVYNRDSEKILPHPSGVYIEEVPVDPITGLCSFDYKYGAEHGFMKIDLLSNSVYDKFKTKDDILYAAYHDVDWREFERKETVEQLPHIANHFDIVEQVGPKSIEELADILALIRPGKRYLLDEYVQNKKSAQRKLYRRPREDLNYFKKSHAISYAVMIVCYLFSIKNHDRVEW